MRALDAVAARLARSDMFQAAALLFVALAFTLAIQWPSGYLTANESWFAVAPVRLSLIAFGALAWGAGLGARPRSPGRGRDVDGPEPAPLGSDAWRGEVAATAGALVVLVLATLPFEVATRAASYPDIDVVWSVAVPVLAVAGYIGLGLLVGLVAARARLASLLALLVPLVFGATIWLDVSVERTILNPWSAALAVSVPFAVALSCLSLVTLRAVLPARRSPAGGVGDATTAAGSGGAT